MKKAYAVKMPGCEWRIAEKCRAENYGTGLSDDPARKLVWSAMPSTAFLGFVGDEANAIELPATEGET